VRTLSFTPNTAAADKPAAEPNATPAAASAAAEVAAPATTQATQATAAITAPGWADDAQRELAKIPFFVRGKARRNTERYAVERGMSLITLETLYDAKAHYAS
jgi:light-independent protochlorophyllide reductase subunit B